MSWGSPGWPARVARSAISEIRLAPPRQSRELKKEAPCLEPRWGCGSRIGLTGPGALSIQIDAWDGGPGYDRRVCVDRVVPARRNDRKRGLLLWAFVSCALRASEQHRHVCRSPDHPKRVCGSRRPPGDGLVGLANLGGGCDHLPRPAPGGRGLPLPGRAPWGHGRSPMMRASSVTSCRLRRPGQQVETSAKVARRGPGGPSDISRWRKPPVRPKNAAKPRRGD